MKNEALEERIIKYLDHNLSRSDAADFENELAQNAEMQELLQVLRAERDLEYILQEEAIRKKVRFMSGQPTDQNPSFWKSNYPYAIGLTAILCLLYAGWLILAHSSPEESTTPIPEKGISTDSLPKPVQPAQPVVSPAQPSIMDAQRKMAMNFKPALNEVMDSEIAKGQYDDVFEPGITALKNGNNKAAKAFFSQMEKKGLLEDNSCGNFFMGYALFSLKEFKQAEVYFRRADGAAFRQQSQWMLVLTRLALFGKNDSEFIKMVLEVSSDNRNPYKNKAQLLHDTIIR